jgi:glycosyltransferase involved in cell wall biosynthesis
LAGESKTRRLQPLQHDPYGPAVDFARQGVNYMGPVYMSNAVPAEPIRILLIAEHASAEFGGEALIPFQYFKRFRETNVNVRLLVHRRTEKELRIAFPRDFDRIHFVSDSLFNVLCWKIGRLFPAQLDDVTFGALTRFETQIRQRRFARSIVKEYSIDVVHEPISVSPKLPSFSFGLGAPVIIGPMNGGMEYPTNFRTLGRAEQFIVNVLRFTASFLNLMIPGKRRAALLLVANKRTFDALPQVLRRKHIIQLVENGVDLVTFTPRAVADQVASDSVFRIIYIGRMVDMKRVDLLLEACTRLVGKIEFVLDLIGDGPAMETLTLQIQRASIASSVRFHGYLSHKSTAALLRDADVLVLPSMYES